MVWVDGLVVLALVFSSGWLNFMRSDNGLDINQFLLIALYLSFIPGLVSRRKVAVQVAARDPFLWALVGITILSALWSDVPLSTFARSLGIMASTLFSLSLAVRYDLKALIRLLTWTVGLVLGLSLLVSLLLPEYGVMTGLHAGSWQGIYAHKNHLGRMMLLGAVLFLFQALSEHPKRKWFWLGFGLSLFVLVMAGSATSLSVFGILIGLVPLYKTLRLKRSLTIALLSLIAAGVVGGVWMLVTNVDLLIGILGRDLTLTGRTLVWGAVIPRIVERPWLGYGYGGFWTGWDGWAGSVWQASGWTPGDAHNGFLDLLLELGGIGASAFVLSLLRNYARAAAFVRATRISDGLWPLTFMTCLALYNVSESALLRPTNLFWILYVSTALAMRVPERLESPGQVVPILRRRLLFIVAMPVMAAAVAGLITQYVLTPVYRASTTIWVTEADAGSIQYGDLLVSRNLAKTYAHVATSRSVMAEAIEHIGLEGLTVETLQRRLTVTPILETEILSFTTEDTNPVMAARLADAVTIAFQEQLRSHFKVENLAMMDAALVPTAPVRPHLVINVAVAFVIGFLVAVGWVFLVDHLDTRIRSEEDAARLGLPVLAVIPIMQMEARLRPTLWQSTAEGRGG